jgi:hypothetical protein
LVGKRGRPLAHQARDALAADPDAMGQGKLGMDAGCAVDARDLVVDLADALAKLRVAKRAAEGGRFLQA